VKGPEYLLDIELELTKAKARSAWQERNTNMKKIQFDTVNGIQEVADFDADAIIMYRLKMFDIEGVEDGLYGAEIDEDLFEQLETEYGISKMPEGKTL